MAQNSNRFWLESIFFSDIEEELNSSIFEPSQSYMHVPSRVNTSFDVFLSHFKGPRVYLIWYKSWRGHERDIFKTRGVDIDMDIFEIKTVHFAKSLQKKYSEVEYWSNGNPSVRICRWRKRYSGKQLFENIIFSTLKFSFKIPKTPLYQKSKRFKIKKKN